ncbi:MAG: calcium/sodium antiporter [Gemmatimonadales bacterium]|nr:calcium/sodium antiporter [Gemmatimonadales bacterium]MDZ4388355.1 calcium/sodium antiporter [Gemmatimonadales bacterium]
MSSGILIAAGLIVLVIGGETLVRGAAMLARRLGVAPAVIGLTVVAIGTSVPELVVAVLAALRGAPDIAIGNVIGSNLVNLTASLGIAALLVPLSVRGQAIKLEWPVLFLATAVTLACLRDARLDRLEGFVLVTGLVAFVSWTVVIARRNITPAERSDLVEVVAERVTLLDRFPGPMAALLVLAGVAALVLGGQWVVDGAVALAREIGMSDRVIGLTIVAVGTGLPELVTSLVAAARRESDIAVANMIGSSIFNLLGILGASALIYPFNFDPALAGTDLLWLLAVTMGIWPILHTGRTITRAEGGLMVTTYAVYLFLLVRS